ncbi:hypA-like protein [Aspergillus bombycis]|uniref:HypA-like protein n=1 Tax=Aspergillus bombycis TaxID=109264 RepID=A0A1F7ZZ94_9EURO|nr:hypA-like protein [Aspergillus bombycis]OGM44780.1 hypA-like protein [Aspergillus bombycis]
MWIRLASSETTSRVNALGSPMATARKIELSTSDSGVYSTGVREDAARAASQVLQENLEKHHMYFNDSGFHNHIVHHILTIFALGASPDEIMAAYERNKAYQRPALPANESVVQSLYDQARFKDCLGKRDNYPNFLEFFQREIEKKGVENVINQYIFAGDDIAEDMLVRLFGGLIHPLIHLGFGIEFNQPAIVAEALAQAATHEDWTGPMFLLPAEKAAGGIGKPGKKALLQILEEIRSDEKLANSAHWDDGNRMKDGVLVRAPDEMIKHAAEFTISEDQMEEKLVEIVNTVAYFTATAQRPSKQVKFDFFYIHGMNASIFLVKFISLPWLDVRSKLRLLEWKGRLNLLLYVSRNTPELYLNDVIEYQASRTWADIFAYANAHPRDDGHISKLTRAVAIGERICRPYEAQAKNLGLTITGDMWLKIGNMDPSAGEEPTMAGDDNANRDRDPSAQSSQLWPDDDNPFVAFRRFADEQISSVLQSSHPTRRQSPPHDPFDIDFFFDSFFDKFWFDDRVSSRFFHPYNRPLFSSMVNDESPAWPVTYLMFSPYSPLHLERQAQYRSSREHGVFSSLMSTLNLSAEHDPAEPQWREAFEDLLRLENGKPMLDRDPADVSKRESGKDWLQGLVKRGSLGDRFKYISGTEGRPWSTITFDNSKNMEDSHSLAEKEALSDSAKAEISWGDAEPDSVTELDMYDRFLADIEAREREFFNDAHESPLLRLLLEDRYRAADNRASLKQANWVEDTESSLGRVPGENQKTVSKTDSQSATDASPAETDKSVAEKSSYVISTKTSTERIRLPDGSIQTKTVKTQRFADGREESNESVEVVNPSQVSRELTSLEGAPSDGKPSGWFWKGE